MKTFNTQQQTEYDPARIAAGELTELDFEHVIKRGVMREVLRTVMGRPYEWVLLNWGELMNTTPGKICES
jgi:hypothetical protein